MTEINRSSSAGAPGVSSASAWPQPADQYAVTQQPPDSPARRREGGGQANGTGEGGAGPVVTVDHVADYTKRYPGEVVTLHTRVCAAAAVPGFTLRVELPAGAELDKYRAEDPGHLPELREVATPPRREAVMLPGADGEPFPIARPDQPTRLLEPPAPAKILVWEVAEPLAPGDQYHFEAAVLILPVRRDIVLRSQAAVYVDQSVAGEETGGAAPETASQVQSQRVDTETVDVQVQAKGRYLSHLPALFEQDEFMGRFLMLFESFWRPIEQQIGSIDHYFDPDLTPSRFLPWLASWFDLTLDESLDDSQRRELLNSVIWLYRRRGTRLALQRYLAIYTRAPVEILERRAKNFILGAGARLGVGVALGRANQPHTFTVRIRLAHVTLAPEEAEKFSDEEAAAEIERREEKRLALLHRLIQAEKPAHTSYRLEILPAADEEAGVPEGAPGADRRDGHEDAGGDVSDSPGASSAMDSSNRNAPGDEAETGA